jgi:hypothetical protein
LLDYLLDPVYGPLILLPFSFTIVLCKSCIAYDKPSYLLDDFSGFHLCSRVDPLPYNPARYSDFNKPPQLLGSRPSYFLVVMTPYVSLHLYSSTIVQSPPSRSSLSISHESHLSVPSGSFLPASCQLLCSQWTEVHLSWQLVQTEFLSLSGLAFR